MAAAREDGHTEYMVPKGFPAVSDSRLAIALYDTARALKYKAHLGVTLTSGVFYNGPAIASTL